MIRVVRMGISGHQAGIILCDEGVDIACDPRAGPIPLAILDLPCQTMRLAEVRSLQN